MLPHLLKVYLIVYAVANAQLIFKLSTCGSADSSIYFQTVVAPGTPLATVARTEPRCLSDSATMSVASARLGDVRTICGQPPG